MPNLEKVINEWCRITKVGAPDLQPTNQTKPSQCQIPTHEQQGKYQNGKFIYTQKANYMIECKGSGILLIDM